MAVTIFMGIFVILGALTLTYSPASKTGPRGYQPMSPYSPGSTLRL